MDLLSIVLILLVVGVLLGLANYYGPQFHVDGRVLKLINAVVIIALILWVLTLFGVLPLMRSVKVGGIPQPDTMYAAIGSLCPCITKTSARSG